MDHTLKKRQPVLWLACRESLNLLPTSFLRVPRERCVSWGADCQVQSARRVKGPDLCHAYRRECSLCESQSANLSALTLIAACCLEMRLSHGSCLEFGVAVYSKVIYISVRWPHIRPSSSLKTTDISTIFFFLSIIHWTHTLEDLSQTHMPFIVMSFPICCHFILQWCTEGLASIQLGCIHPNWMDVRVKLTQRVRVNFECAVLLVTVSSFSRQFSVAISFSMLQTVESFIVKF